MQSGPKQTVAYPAPAPQAIWLVHSFSNLFPFSWLTNQDISFSHLYSFTRKVSIFPSNITSLAESHRFCLLMLPPSKSKTMVNYSCVWTVEEYFASFFAGGLPFTFQSPKPSKDNHFFFSFPFHLGRHVIGWSSIQRLAVSVRNVRFRPSWAILSYLQPIQPLPISFVFMSS
jgi:hypothetical protein